MRFEAAAIEWKKHDMRHADLYDIQDAEKESLAAFTYSVRFPSLPLSSDEEPDDKDGAASDKE
jgi:hypothetical protein